MFFIVSKIFWMLVQPLSLSILLLLGGWLFMLFGRRRLAMLSSALGLVIITLSSFTTLGALLIKPLEDRFVRPVAITEPVGTIVVLGGSTSAKISTGRAQTELNTAGDRLTEALRLARLYPAAKILLSGGSGTIMEDSEPEAISASRLLEQLGIAPERLIIEEKSRNTDENAQFSKALMAETAGATILVTSAFHMPRSIGLFRKQGIDVIPWPTDYRSAGDEGFWLDPSYPVTNFETTGVAIREWVGLAVYNWTGRIDEMFPGQDSN